MMRYVVSDWAGPIGVYTVMKELARDLTNLIAKGSEVTDFNVLAFPDGTMLKKDQLPLEMRVSEILKHASLCISLPKM